MRNMSASAAAILLIIAVSAPESSSAGTVAVTTGDGLVTIDAADASIDEILTKLGEAQGFQFDLGGKKPETDAVSGRFEGSLKSVLTRILHNESYMIVHSSKSTTGIERIVLFGDGNVPNAVPAPGTPARVAPASAVDPRARAAAVASVQPRPLPREVIPPPPPARQAQTRSRSGVVN